MSAFSKETLQEVTQLKKESSSKVVSFWQKRFKETKEGNIKTSSIFNIELILENDELLKNKIGYNEFNGFIYVMEGVPMLSVQKGTWSDSNESAVLTYIETKYGVLFDVKKLRHAVDNVSRRNMFNPVKTRIEKVQWDKKSRVESYFIDLLGVEDNIYTREVTKRWIVGIVTRTYKPATKFEIVPVLDGKQGIGKSTAPRLLIGDEYFSDSLESLGNKKDDYLQLRNNAVLELGELSSMKKTDIDKIKNFISASYDDIRLPYGHYTIKWARRCVFIGTSNNSEYLKDETGSRRFYPLPCRNEPKRDIFNMEESYFLQVLAEAKELYDAGQKVYFNPKEDKEVFEYAQMYQENAKVDDPVKDAVEKFLEMEVPADWEEVEVWVKKSYYTYYPESKKDERNRKHFNYPDRLLMIDSVLTTEILEIVFDTKTSDYLSGRTNGEAKRINLILENIGGWEKKQLYNKNRRRGFFNNKHYAENKKRNTKQK